VERPRCIEIEGVQVGFIPYYREYEDFKKAWERLHSVHSPILGRGLDVVCFHQFLPGISYKSGHRIPGKFDLELRPGTRYISGHLHQACKVLDDKVQYLGSPYQVSFGEGGDKKYIYLLDTKTRDFKPMQLSYPEFQTVNIHEDFTQPFVKGHYIKLTGDLTPDQREMVNRTKTQILAWGAAGVTTNIHYMREVKKRIVSSSNAPQDVIAQFVGGMSKALTLHLDKSKLINIGESLLQGVKQ
jgi:DNA repair exonuclease SbcCD nuclease subunit